MQFIFLPPVGSSQLSQSSDLKAEGSTSVARLPLITISSVFVSEISNTPAESTYFWYRRKSIPPSTLFLFFLTKECYMRLSRNMICTPFKTTAMYHNPSLINLHAFLTIFTGWYSLRAVDRKGSALWHQSSQSQSVCFHAIICSSVINQSMDKCHSRGNDKSLLSLATLAITGKRRIDDQWIEYIDFHRDMDEKCLLLVLILRVQLWLVIKRAHVNGREWPSSWTGRIVSFQREKTTTVIVGIDKQIIGRFIITRRRERMIRRAFAFTHRG